MKTILVPTDFSGPAENAALYAMHLAKAMKCNIHLCNAFTVPADSPLMSGVSWSLYDYPELLEECNKKLEKVALLLKEQNDKNRDAEDSQSQITYSCEVGDISLVINENAKKNHAVLTVMGMTGMGKLERFIMGSNSVRMINTSEVPVLILPFNQNYKGLNKIVFSTDLHPKDIKIAQAVIKFAKYFNAETIIAHIKDFIDTIDADSYEERKNEFVKEIGSSASYLSIDSDNIESGFDKLKKMDIDLLVMEHRNRRFLDRLVLGSYSARQAREMELPLMVIPEDAILDF